MPVRQPDLFDRTGQRAAPAAPVQRTAQAVDATALDDEALVAAIPGASRTLSDPLATEAARRGLPSAVPALEALCRRFKGFGLQRPVPEQAAALRALAGIGGTAAAHAVTRIIEDGVAAGPGLPVAMNAAKALGCRLSADTAAMLLRHADPDVRAPAARCAPLSGDIPAILADLLAAAVALGRAGRAAARPALLRLLGNQPSAELINAIAPVADGTVIVLLGRIARAQPGLAAAAIAALRDIDDARAAALINRMSCGS
jgi:hypothetical protein